MRPTLPRQPGLLHNRCVWNVLARQVLAGQLQQGHRAIEVMDRCGLPLITNTTLLPPHAEDVAAVVPGVLYLVIDILRQLGIGITRVQLLETFGLQRLLKNIQQTFKLVLNTLRLTVSIVISLGLLVKVLDVAMAVLAGSAVLKSAIRSTGIWVVDFSIQTV